MASATVMGLVFGQPKRTKTSTVASAFPNALWIPGEGANAILSVCQNEWGYEPTVYDHPIRTLDDLVDLLSVIEENNLTQEYGAICVDGMTALCESSLRYWQDNPKLTQSGKVDKFWPYQQLKDRLLRLAERGRHIGVNMFFVAHEQAPGAGMDGSFVPGGPSLGSKGQVVRVPAWCDFNARAVVNQDYPDPWLKTGLYVDPWDSTWVTGDRNGVGYATAPPNVRELLRASAVDYGLSRLKGLEWQDEVADKVADHVMQGDIDGAINEGASLGQKFAKGSGRAPQLHIRWAIQDGIARGVIQKYRTASLFDLQPVKSSKASKPAKTKKAAPPPSE